MMRNELNTDEVINNMVDAVCGQGATARERHMYRETLRNLVRLAKAEQMAEMRVNVEKLTAFTETRTNKVSQQERQSSPASSCQPEAKSGTA
jgi:hypothetical protein